MAQHIMLSYQWDVQDLVKKIFEKLKSRGFPVWMDIEGGMSSNINDSMAFGVDNAVIVCPVMTQKYSESKNCKKELNYADAQEKEIVPIMGQDNFKATGWLGIITAGLLWMDFRNPANIDKSVDSLGKEIQHRCTDIQLQKSLPEPPKYRGRAFRNFSHGKFLAESGEVKTHVMSGSRSTLVLRDTPEATSYWTEERDSGNKEIYYYKNFATNMYLGYDPNGDYIYTKAEHYGAEQWNLVCDESSKTGARAVVIFAAFGQKYLAIKKTNDGLKLTGVSTRDADCVWTLE